MAGICASSYSSPHPIEKVGDSPYPFPVNAGIPRQNGDGFGQYPRGRVYLSSLFMSVNKCYRICHRNIKRFRLGHELWSINLLVVRW